MRDNQGIIVFRRFYGLGFYLASPPHQTKRDRDRDFGADSLNSYP